MSGPNTSPIVPGTIVNNFQTFQNSDSTTSKVVFTPGTNGSRCDSISLTSTDTSNNYFSIIVNDGTTDHVVGRVYVPLGSGTSNGVPSVQVITLANLPWLPASGSIFLASGMALKLAAITAVTSTKLVDVVSFGGAY